MAMDESAKAARKAQKSIVRKKKTRLVWARAASELAARDQIRNRKPRRAPPSAMTALAPSGLGEVANSRGRSFHLSWSHHQAFRIQITIHHLNPHDSLPG